MKGINKKGQHFILLGIMLSVIIFSFIMISVPYLFKNYNFALIGSDKLLDCSNTTSLSIGEKGSCTLMNFYFFYWASLVLGASITYISGKNLVAGQ
jgi:hypothetical protein